MQYMVYVSRHNIKQVERVGVVAKILEQSSTRNINLDITGMLIVGNEYFAQVLEGEEINIQTLMASIGRDPRHHDVRTLWRWEMPTRQFPGWRMSHFYEANLVPFYLGSLLRTCHEGVDPGANERLANILDETAFKLASHGS